MKFISAANFLIFFLLSAIQVFGQNIITFDGHGWSNDQVLPSDFTVDNYSFSSKIKFFTNYGYNFNVNTNSLYYVFQKADSDIITITNIYKAIEEFKSVDAYQVSQTSTDTLVIEGWMGNDKLYTKSFTRIYSWQKLNLDYKNVNKIVIKISPSTSTQLTDYNFDNFTFIDTAMPVELTTFKATNEDGCIMLTWQTATETNNFGFEVQRTPLNPPFGKGGTQGGWTKIGFVKGVGNSSVPQTYSFTDKSITGGSGYEYRLKQIDYNGNYIYSNVLEITANQIIKDYSLSQNYPNPFNPSTKIDYSIPKAGMVVLKVYDLLGNEVSTLVNGYKQAGSYSVIFNALKLASGMYIYELKSSGYFCRKKMIFLK